MFFLLLCAWTAAAGLLLGAGLAHHVLWSFAAGLAMSAVCPLGVIAVWLRVRSSR